MGEINVHSSNIILAAAAAKSLQSCPTLCNPIDGSPPGSPVPGILQARILEWVAISFSNLFWLVVSNFHQLPVSEKKKVVHPHIYTFIYVLHNVLWYIINIYCNWKIF